jgi:tRNA(fMet)-specific endonuclease VapC
MRYLLDANICIMYLNGRSMLVRDRLLSTPIEEMAVCSVVKEEHQKEPILDFTQTELFRGL